MALLPTSRYGAWLVRLGGTLLLLPLLLRATPVLLLLLLGRMEQAALSPLCSAVSPLQHVAIMHAPGSITSASGSFGSFSVRRRWILNACECCLPGASYPGVPPTLSLPLRCSRHRAQAAIPVRLLQTTFLKSRQTIAHLTLNQAPIAALGTPDWIAPNACSWGGSARVCSTRGAPGSCGRRSPAAPPGSKRTVPAATLPKISSATP